MYIQPNSTIQILRGVPLNPNYKDTIYFDSIGFQTAYFDNYVAYTFTEQYYQRANKNSCRVKINAEQVYDCNYMRFRNDSFGNKNFYAFITNIEYINHNVTEITYEIDILQTWAFDYSLGKCYVEREHANSDTIGEHLLPEPVEIDDYICTDVTMGGFEETSFYLFCSDPIDAHINGGLYDGTYSVGYYSYPCTIAGAIALDQKIADIIYDNGALRPGGAESIVGLFIGPSKFPPAYGTEKPWSTYTVSVPRPDSLAGYVPNNNKLFTSPFMYLEVDCLNDNKSFAFEYFLKNFGQADFKCIGSCVGNASVICVPIDYKKPNFNDYTQQLVMGGYPMCIVPIDSVKNWLANNAVYHVLTGIASAGTAGVGLATGNPYLIAGGISGMVSNVAKATMETNRHNTSRGTVSTSINVQDKSKDFYFKTMTLRTEKSRSIDDFFSRYGYTCEQVKVPNRKVRKRWTYTKTHNCIVNGNLPADDKQKISKIFDNGITFWTTVGVVGDYVMNDNGVI